MLKCKIDRGMDDYIEFNCPKCGAADVAYIKMPDNCYQCGVRYDEDLQELLISKSARLRYHFKKEKPDDKIQDVNKGAK